MATKAVTEQGIKFWILELLAEDPKAQWFDLEKHGNDRLKNDRFVQIRQVCHF
jgi:hypothetical protein